MSSWRVALSAAPGVSHWHAQLWPKSQLPPRGWKDPGVHSVSSFPQHLGQSLTCNRSSLHVCKVNVASIPRNNNHTSRSNHCLEWRSSFQREVLFCFVLMAKRWKRLFLVINSFWLRARDPTSALWILSPFCGHFSFFVLGLFCSCVLVSVFCLDSHKLHVILL